MIIDDLIYNYIDAIKNNLYNCKIKLKHICIYNVVPPVNKYNTQENKDCPYLGSDEERKQYVLYIYQAFLNIMKLRVKYFTGNLNV